jgi:hypothetical protein
MKVEIMQKQLGSGVGQDGDFVAVVRREDDGEVMYQLQIDNRAGWDGAIVTAYYGPNAVNFEGNIWSVPDFIDFLQQAWSYKKLHETAPLA